MAQRLRQIARERARCGVQHLSQRLDVVRARIIVYQRAGLLGPDGQIEGRDHPVGAGDNNALFLRGAAIAINVLALAELAPQRAEVKDIRGPWSKPLMACIRIEPSS